MLRNDWALKEWIEVKVELRVFIAAVPKLNTTKNKLKITYVQEELKLSLGIDQPTHEFLKYIEIAIIGGGLVLSCVCVMAACFIRRF